MLGEKTSPLISRSKKKEKKKSIKKYVSGNWSFMLMKGGGWMNSWNSKMLPFFPNEKKKTGREGPVLFRRKGDHPFVSRKVYRSEKDQSISPLERWDKSGCGQTGGRIESMTIVKFFLKATRLHRGTLWLNKHLL